MRTANKAALLLSGLVLAAAPAHAALLISKGKTANVSCQGGICNATAADAVLNVKDLANMLATSDVKVFAEGIATDINVSDPFSWTSIHQLTLGAYGSIAVKAAITVAGTSGLTINANVAQTGGVFKLVGVGKIIFWDTSSSLTINNVTYTLINNLPALISAIMSNPSGTYAFVNDYNAAQDGSYPHSPIPTTFTGTFEGLGNAINNLSVYDTTDGTEKIALFTEVGTGGQLSDVNLVNVSIQTGFNNVTTLAYYNNGTVIHSSVSGSISNLNGEYVDVAAGFVLDNQGTITRSHAAVNMADADQAGGLVLTNEGTISFSDSAGSVSAYGIVGGLAASSTGSISDSFAQGDVNLLVGDDADAGGLVGQFVSGSIFECFATGSVSAGETRPGKTNFPHMSTKRFTTRGIGLGGLVGYSGGAIQYSYATGRVSAQADGDTPSAVGGLVGRTEKNAGPSSIREAYVLGHLSLNAHKFIGGVMGTDYSPSGSNYNAFWDLDTTGFENPDRGAGDVFDDKGLKGYADNKFRKAAMRKFDPSIWAEAPNINNGYPYLIANPPPQ